MSNQTFGKIGRSPSGDIKNAQAVSRRKAPWSRKTIAGVALGVIFPGLFLGIASQLSGETISAADACYRKVHADGYLQTSTDWSAPIEIIERDWTFNYADRKHYESRLLVCKYLQSEPIVTCGPLKCGGLFSLASESTEARLNRTAQLTEAELKRLREAKLKWDAEREIERAQAQADQLEADKDRKYPILKRRTCVTRSQDCR